MTDFKASDFRALVSDFLPIGPVNVSRPERQWTGGLGGALLLAGLGARHRAGSLMAVAGGILLFRAVTGHCPAYTALGLGQEKGSGQGQMPGRQGRPVPPRQPAHGGWREAPRSSAMAEVLGGPDPAARSTRRRPAADDGVQEASEESFPASDPPSFMAGTGMAGADTAGSGSGSGGRRQG